MDYWVRHMRWPPTAHHPKGYKRQDGLFPTGRKVARIPPCQFRELKKLSGKVLTGLSESEGTRYTDSKVLPLRLGREARMGVLREARDEVYDDKRILEYLGKLSVEIEPLDLGLDSRSAQICRSLLCKNCHIPESLTRYQDGYFDFILSKLRSSNETGILQLVRDLLLPSTDMANHYGLLLANNLVESLAEPWECSVPLDDQSPDFAERFIQCLPGVKYNVPIPQPDHSVGLSKTSFSSRQHLKMQPYITSGLISYFKGTPKMFFPFFTAEVKQKPQPGLVAELQNIHSMTVAMRGVVELYRRVHPQKVQELSGMVLGFSISLGIDKAVIHAYYIRASRRNNVTYHRTVIDTFNWTLPKNRWKCYKFAMAVYSDFAQLHYNTVITAINALPDENKADLNPPPWSPIHGTRTEPPGLGNIPDVDIEYLEQQFRQAPKASREMSISEGRNEWSGMQWVDFLGARMR
ncbi:hypothetical protein BJX70DRAFT_357954 [Aspergillus crustosus]